MNEKVLWTSAAALLLAGGAFALHFASPRAIRPDCPGRIVCPVTGQEICADQCPLDARAAKPEPVPGCCLPRE